MNASYRGRPISPIPRSSRFAAARASNSPACSATNARASSGVYAAWKNWLIVPRLLGNGNTTPRCVVYTRCTYDVNAVNRFTYSHTVAIDVWNRCAPYR